MPRGNLAKSPRHRKVSRAYASKSKRIRQYHTTSLIENPSLKKNYQPPVRCLSAPKVMDSNSRSASPREASRPQHRPPSPPTPVGIENQAFQSNEDPNHNESFISNGTTQNGVNGHSKEPNGHIETKVPVPEAVNLELINLNPRNGKKKDVEVDMGASNPYDEYFVPVNEHKKYMRGEKLYVTVDKRSEKNGCKRPLCWTIVALVVAAAVALIILAATGVLFASTPTPVDEYNTTISSARALGSLTKTHSHNHDHDGNHEHNEDHIHDGHDSHELMYENDDDGHANKNHDDGHAHKNDDDGLANKNDDDSHSNKNDDDSHVNKNDYHDHSHAVSEVSVLPKPNESTQNDDVQSDNSSMYVQRVIEGELVIDNEVFTPALADPDSHEYQDFTGNFSKQLRSALFDRETLENGSHDIILEIVKLQKGSIIVTYRIHWKPKSNYEADDNLITTKSLMDRLNEYLDKNRRMVNVYHIAEDRMTTKKVLDICQINRDDCEHDCAFDEKALEFVCTCPDGEITDIDNPKKCTSIFEAGNNVDLKHKEFRVLDVDKGITTSRPIPEQDKPNTESVYIAEQPHDYTFDWKETQPTTPETITEVSDPKMNYPLVFGLSNNRHHHAKSKTSIPEPEPTNDYKSHTITYGEPAPEPTSEPTVQPKAEPEPFATLETTAMSDLNPKLTSPAPEPSPVEFNPKTETTAENKHEPAPVVEINPEPEPTVESKQKPAQVGELEPTSEPTPEPAPVANLNAIPEPTSELDLVVELNPIPEPVSEPASEPTPVPELSPKTEPTSDFVPLKELNPIPEPTAEPASESTPVPEINLKPEPTSELASVTELNPIPEPTSEPASKPTPVPELNPKSEPTSELGPVTELNPIPEPTSEPASEPTAVPEPTSEFAPVTELKFIPERISEPAPAPELNRKSELTSEPVPATELNTKPELTSEPASKLIPVAELNPEPEPTSEPTPKSDSVAVLNPKPDLTSAPASGAVILAELNPNPEPTSEPTPETTPTAELNPEPESLKSESSVKNESEPTKRVTDNRLSQKSGEAEPDRNFELKLEAKTEKEPIRDYFSEIYENENPHQRSNEEPSITDNDYLSNNHESDVTTMAVATETKSVTDSESSNAPPTEQIPKVISITNETKNITENSAELFTSEGTTTKRYILDEEDPKYETRKKDIINGENHETQGRSFKTVDVEENTTRKEENIVAYEQKEINTKNSHADTLDQSVSNLNENKSTDIERTWNPISYVSTESSFNLDSNAPSSTTTSNEVIKPVTTEYQLSEDKTLMEALLTPTTVFPSQITTDNEMRDEAADSDVFNMLYNRSSKSFMDEMNATQEGNPESNTQTTTESDWLSAHATEVNHEQIFKSMEKQETTAAPATKIEEVMNQGSNNDFDSENYNNFGPIRSSETDELMYGMVHEYDKKDLKVDRIKASSENPLKNIEIIPNTAYETKVAENDKNVVTDSITLAETTEKIMTVSSSAAKPTANETFNYMIVTTTDNILDQTATPIARLDIFESDTENNYLPAPEDMSLNSMYKEDNIGEEQMSKQDHTESSVTKSQTSIQNSPSEITTVSEYIYKSTENETSDGEAMPHISVLLNTKSSVTNDPAPVWEIDYDRDSIARELRDSVYKNMTAPEYIPSTVTATSTTTNFSVSSSQERSANKSSDKENHAQNKTEPSNLNVTIYEVSSHNHNHSLTTSNSSSTRSIEYEDHETEMNPFLPEIENNKSLVKKLQEGHDLEIVAVNDTQNENTEEHRFEAKFQNVPTDEASKGEQSHDTEITFMEVMNSNPNFEQGSNHDTDETITANNSSTEQTSPILPFLQDTDDLEETTEQILVLGVNAKGATKSPEVPTRDTTTLVRAGIESDNLTVVPIHEDKILEDLVIPGIQKRNYKSETSHELNDISDSPKKSDRRTLGANKL